MAIVAMLMMIEASPVVLATDFDIAKLPIRPRRCGQSEGGEIVVCGSTDRRLHNIETIDGEKRAVVNLGGGVVASAHGTERMIGGGGGELSTVPKGVEAPAAMVTFSIPFGRGKKAP
jgi:hypothetical protein